jgi:outer membrane lipoprotein-sorting protein
MVLPLFRYLQRRVPRPIPQLAGASALAVALAVAVATWTSASGGFAPGGAAPARDPVAIAQTAKSSLQRVKTLQARVNGAVGEEPFTGTIALERPNRARVEVSGSESIGRFSVISDGITVYVYFPDSNQYTATKAAPAGQNITAFFVDVVRTFFRPEQLTPAAGRERMALRGTERVGETAVEADVVELTSRRAATATWRYFLERPTGILRRTELTVVAQDRERSSRWNQLENVRIDESVDSRTFQWTIPAGARPLNLSDLGVDLPIQPTPQKRQ